MRSPGGLLFWRDEGINNRAAEISMAGSPDSAATVLHDQCCFPRSRLRTAVA